MFRISVLGLGFFLDLGFGFWVFSFGILSLGFWFSIFGAVRRLAVVDTRLFLTLLLVDGLGFRVWGQVGEFGV